MSSNLAVNYLKELCLEGIKRRGLENDQEAKTRIDYELSAIKQTGFAPYFLIVQDFVNWAKENHIVVGPGRGSVGGSLVAYLLNITNVDPLKYNLLFERFLNPQRISLPDIDLDFTDRRRDEVIEYVANKYGRDKVAQIITFGTMAARAVVRDVGRALNYPYDYCDKIAKMIPFGSTLDQTLAGVEEFRQAYLTDEKAQKLIDFAKKLDVDSVQFSINTPFPGTSYYQEARNKNLILARSWQDFDGAASGVVSFENLTKEEVEKFYQKAYGRWLRYKLTRPQWIKRQMYNLNRSVKGQGIGYLFNRLKRTVQLFFNF